MMLGISLLLLFAVGSGADRQQGIDAFNEGRYAEAQRSLEAAVAQDASDPVASTFLALSQAAQGHCQAAYPTLLKHRQDEDASGRLAMLAAIRCATTSEKQGAPADQAAAFDLLQEALKRFPRDADVLYLAAQFYMKAFNDATYLMFQRTPASYRVHELSAEIFEVNNRFSDAIAEYRKAIELNPQAPELHYRLGRALLLEAHGPDAYTNAAKEFEAELRVSPEDAACEFQLAQIARVQGDAAGFKSHLERAVLFEPNFAQALVALGRVYGQEKQYPKAIALLAKAVASQPDNEAAHYALMTAYRDSGDTQHAQHEKEALDRLQKPPQGEFSDFLKKLDAPAQQP